MFDTNAYSEGEKVVIVETGEEVTIKNWWYGTYIDTGEYFGEVQYAVHEKRYTWFSEHELRGTEK